VMIRCMSRRPDPYPRDGTLSSVHDAELAVRNVSLIPCTLVIIFELTNVNPGVLACDVCA
jgi:hypothetical protein